MAIPYRILEEQRFEQGWVLSQGRYQLLLFHQVEKEARSTSIKKRFFVHSCQIRPISLQPGIIEAGYWFATIGDPVLGEWFLCGGGHWFFPGDVIVVNRDLAEALMWVIPSGLKVYLALGSTDMRKSVNGLSLLVSEILDHDPLSGHLFVFCNRRKTILKILYWDRNGFCLWYKRLEKQRFFWLRGSGADVITLTGRELNWLLDGYDLSKLKPHRKLKYTTVL
jgi:transposase